MRVKCLKCGTIMKSYTRHDFKWCPCENIFVDGGDDYLRFGGPGMEDKSYFVMERMEITIELTENGFSLPIQSDVENIASLTDSDTENLYHEPVKFGDGIYLVWNNDINTWEIKGE